MSFDTYKIVNADELTTNLTSIADALRNKTGIDGNLTFPSGYLTEINKLQYDASPNTADDITVNANGVITAAAGYYNVDTQKDLSTIETIKVSEETIPPAEEEKVAVEAHKFTTGQIKIGAIPKNYVGSEVATAPGKEIIPTKEGQTAISENTYATGNITVAAIPDNFVDVSEITRNSTNITPPFWDDIVTSKSYTIPAGYYQTDTEVVFTETV